MDSNEEEPRMTLQQYLKTHLISGLFVLVPLWITYVVVTAVFRAMASVLKPLVELAPWPLSERVIFCISVLAFVVLMLVAGMIASWVFGRRLLRWGEVLILKVPVIKTIYSASKQIVDAVSLPNKKAFKAVAMIEYPRAGLKTLGFVTGVSTTQDGRMWCRVFVPTLPNPTAGFLEFVPIEEVLVTDLTIEGAFKIIISGGFIAPSQIATRPFRKEDA